MTKLCHDFYSDILDFVSNLHLKEFQLVNKEFQRRTQKFLLNQKRQTIIFEKMEIIVDHGIIQLTFYNRNSQHFVTWNVFHEFEKSLKNNTDLIIHMSSDRKLSEFINEMSCPLITKLFAKEHFAKPESIKEQKLNFYQCKETYVTFVKEKFIATNSFNPPKYKKIEDLYFYHGFIDALLHKLNYLWRDRRLYVVDQTEYYEFNVVWSSQIRKCCYNKNINPSYWMINGFRWESFYELFEKIFYDSEGSNIKRTMELKNIQEYCYTDVYAEKIETLMMCSFNSILNTSILLEIHFHGKIKNFEPCEKIHKKYNRKFLKKKLSDEYFLFRLEAHS